MSEKCIKTGADVYLEQYGKVVHGDLFITADHTYILDVNYDYSNMEPYDLAGGAHADATFHKIVFEKNGILVADSFEVSQSPAFDVFRAKWG